MSLNDKYWRISVWLTAIVALLFLVPYFIMGGNSFVRIHDNLEGEWIWLKLLVESRGQFGIYSWVRIDQVMHGIPRNVMPPGFSVNTLLVQFFGLYKAYLISDTMIRVIGFTGMVLLLKDYLIPEKQQRYIVWFCALIFCVLPVYVAFGLAVMGQPLLFWAFLNLQAYKRIALSYMIVVLFPLYCSMVWFVVPFEVMLGMAVWYYYSREEISNNFIFAGVLLVVIFILVNLPMLSLSVMNPDFISHRLSYNLYMFEKPNLLDSMGEFFYNLFFGHYHVATFSPLIIMISMGLTIRRGDGATTSKLLLGGIIFVCLFQAFYSYGEYALMNHFAFIKSFRFNRFSILLPLVWVMSFALALAKMQQSLLFRKLVFPFLIAQFLIALAGNDMILHNYRSISGHQKFPNFRNYMAPRQFEEIKKYIGLPVDSYYVASLGMSPSIAQYNGMYTIDGLLSIYDLRYKQDFRRIFAGEIAKSKDIQQYYDGWGNRCYIFSAELGTKQDAYNCNKFEQRSISQFDFDKKAFADMGGRYLISAVEIRNAAQEGLHLEKVFRDEESWWVVYLYSIGQ